jgi:hypothetical protein
MWESERSLVAGRGFKLDERRDLRGSKSGGGADPALGGVTTVFRRLCFLSLEFLLRARLRPFGAGTDPALGRVAADGRLDERFWELARPSNAGAEPALVVVGGLIREVRLPPETFLVRVLGPRGGADPAFRLPDPLRFLDLGGELGMLRCGGTQYVSNVVT